MHDFPRFLAAALLLAVWFPDASRAADLRRMTPDDLFRIEELGEVAMRPDGAEAAVVVRSPVTAGRGHGRPLLLGGDRSDVFLVSTAGGAPRPLTHGAADGSGSWRPLWSPNGSHLAFLSTRGGDNVRLFVWDGETQSIRRLTDDGVDLWAAVDPATKAPFAWLDDHRLLCALVAPGGTHRAFSLDFPTRKGEAEGWAGAAKGNAPTSSVLDSGTGPSPKRRATPGRLALVDAVSGSVATVAEGNCIEALAAPDRRHVAVVVETGRYQPKEGQPLPPFTDRNPSRLGVAALAGPDPVHWVAGFEPRTKIRRVQLSWAGDSSQIAVIGKTNPEADRAETLFLARIDGNFRRVGAEDFRVSSTTRVGDLVLAHAHLGPTGRDEWWSVDVSDGAKVPARLAAGSGLLPESWFPIGPRAALGVAGGKLWRLDASTSDCQELTLPEGRKPVRLIRPAGTDSGLVAECRPLAGASAGDFVILPLDPNATKPVFSRPDPKVRLVDAGPQGAAVYTASDADGTTAWTSPGIGRPATRPIVLNRFLAEVADAQFRVVDYRGSDGGALKAHLLLPPGHKDGDRHPAVVWVYAGSMLGSEREPLLEKNSRHPMNMVLLASRGYAVLVPSMPLGPEGKAADPLIELPKGVLPAVDRMVEMGLADPARIAVMGHSYGGYSVYGLLTQTRRFRAGIAMAGITDLVALHGTLDARVRYEADPFYNLFGPKWTEVGQGRMGASPWVDPDRFRRNSPITYVDRVRTPLLMIHGDADFVPLQQAEEFYTGLFRLGRRARLVRYWGEGHVFESPANIRDMWTQIFAWLDEHLAPPRSERN